MERKRQKEIGTLIAQDRSKGYQQTDVFPDRIPIEKFRVIWNDEQVQYSDEQLFKIREWLYAMCNVALSVAEEQFDNRNKIIELKPEPDEAKESHFIHSSEYRRAS
jgi:hypothetical protein